MFTAISVNPFTWMKGDYFGDYTPNTPVNDVFKELWQVFIIPVTYIILVKEAFNVDMY